MRLLCSSRPSQNEHVMNGKRTSFPSSGRETRLLVIRFDRMTHVQGVASQPFDLSKQFSESILPAQKFALKYQ